MTEPFELLRDEKGRLTLKRPGHDDVPDVRVRRAFPWSNTSHFVSIRGDGKEVLIIDDITQLPDGQRTTIEQALAETSFIPRITHIESVDMIFGHQEWKVQTDRGPAQFRVQEREDVRFLPDGRFAVKDADGNVYEMPRFDQLDEHSRQSVERLL
jgi:hypothetical protein